MTSDGYPPAATRRRGLGQGAIALLAHKLPRGETRRSFATGKLVAVFALLAAAIAGCGGGSGVASGATVRVYVAQALCPEAKHELARAGGEAGDVKLRVVCLPNAEKGGKLNLARIGANARQATQDSSSIAYIGEPTKAASRFSEPILESAGIAQLQQSSGAAAMAQLLKALNQAGESGSLRASVQRELE